MTRIVRYYPRALVGDGGMTGAVRRWSRALARAGADVTLAFAGGPRPPDGDDVNWSPVRHVGRGAAVLPVGLEHVLRGADLLVLHSGWTLHNVRAAAVARSLGVPYMLEPRGAYDPHIVQRKHFLKRAWWRALERKLVSEARAVHVFFEQERAHLQALGYRGHVVIASNGADPPEGSIWDGGSGGYLLWLGRFDPEHKGLDLLLRALRAVPESERPFLRLHGPDWRGRKRRVRMMVADLGLQQWVAVGEAVYGEAKRGLLTSAAGFVYPSRWDACPNSVLEAVSLSIPTLATPYPLACMIAESGGALVSEGRAAALADGIRDLLSERAVQVGSRGAQVAREELSWDRVARSWLTQVQAVL
jgi:glycosyltransferase involved in cell wall biosynthesis